MSTLWHEWFIDAFVGFHADICCNMLIVVRSWFDEYIHNNIPHKINSLTFFCLCTLLLGLEVVGLLEFVFPMLGGEFCFVSCKCDVLVFDIEIL